MGFKEDAEFARYLTIGVHGTLAVARDLAGHGHQMVELERYAVGNKIWGVRPKRLRMPDLLCILCGRRFESKGKSKLELKLSHSGKEGRSWDAGGMRPDDVFAFVWVQVAADGVETGRPVYVTREALRASLGSVTEGTRKAVQSGSEADIKWPSWVPSYGGTVVSFDTAAQTITVTRKSDGRKMPPYKTKKWATAYLFVPKGQDFVGGRDVVAAVVEPANVDCPGRTWNWQKDLTSADKDDRYAALRAARHLGFGNSQAELEKLATDTDEDWRVSLEAVAVLVQHDPEKWVPEVRTRAENTELPLDQQMEAVFVLSELAAPAANDALFVVATSDPARHEEVRAAAVWGLGTGALPDHNRVCDLLDDASDRVALHAAATLPDSLAPSVTKHLAGWLRQGTARQMSIAGTLLARKGELMALREVALDTGAKGRLIAQHSLGSIPKAEVQRSLGDALDADLEARLDPLWVSHEDWTLTVENAGALEILEAQRLRSLGIL